MKYRKLGRTGLTVSEIGLGCSGFWGDKLFSDAKALRIVHTAFERGVNFFDTGSNYSNFNAEPRLGRAVKEILKANARDRIVLSTKAGSTLGYAPTVKDDDLRFGDFSRDNIEKSCIASIKNLNCDYIDVFQLHGFEKTMLNDDLFKRLQSLRQRGLIRATGVNTHFKDDLLHIARYPEVFDMVLTDYNVLQLDRRETLETVATKGIGVAVGTVLAQGHLVGRKIGSVSNGSYFWYLARTLIKPTTRDFARAAKPMRETLSAVPGMTPAQAAFAFVLQSSAVSSCLFGTTDLHNLAEVIDASDMTLDAASAAAIARTYAAGSSLSR